MYELVKFNRTGERCKGGRFTSYWAAASAGVRCLAYGCVAYRIRQV